MFSTGFQPEPQFCDETFAPGKRVLANHFIVCDSFARFRPSLPGLDFGDDVLTQFVPAQLKPVPPGALGSGTLTLHKGHIFTLHGVSFELLDQVVARISVCGNAKNSTRILIETMHR
jgi:hypothetical protein